MGVTSVSELADSIQSTPRADRPPRKQGKRATLTAQALSQQEALAKTAPSAVAALKGEGNVIELEPSDVVFRFDVNQRIQSWLNDENPAYHRLKESIRKYSQQQPILVGKKGKDGKYPGYYGSRRRHVAESLGRKVKATICQEALTDEQANQIAILENFHQEPLSEYEEALSVVRRRELFPDHTLAEIAEFFNKKNKSWAYRQLEFASLDERFLQCVTNPWEIKEGPMRELLGVWRDDSRSRRRFEKRLDSMIKAGKRVPYKNLIELLIPPEKKKKPVVLYDDNQVPIVSVLPAKRKRGRLYRSIEVCADSDKEEVWKIIESIIDDPEASIEFSN